MQASESVADSSLMAAGLLSLALILASPAWAQHETLVERSGNEISDGEQFVFVLGGLRDEYDADPANAMHLWGHKLGDQFGEETLEKTVSTLLAVHDAYQEGRKTTDWNTVCAGGVANDKQAQQRLRDLTPNRVKYADKLYLETLAQFEADVAQAIAAHVKRAKTKTSISEPEMPFARASGLAQSVAQMCNLLSAEGASQ